MVFMEIVLKERKETNLVDEDQEFYWESQIIAATNDFLH